jgi:hypothetical protein
VHFWIKRAAAAGKFVHLLFEILQFKLRFRGDQMRGLPPFPWSSVLLLLRGGEELLSSSSSSSKVQSSTQYHTQIVFIKDHHHHHHQRLVRGLHEIGAGAAATR